MRRRRRALAALALLFGPLAACTGDAPPDGAEPLLPGTPYEVLTEARTLGPPSSDGANRLARGWRPDSRTGPGEPPAHYWTSGPVVSVGIVTLTGAARTLILDLEPGPATEEALTAGGHVEVRVDGRPAGMARVADPLRVRLPGDLPPGRHRVELALPDDGRRALAVRAAAVRPADGRGRVEERVAPGEGTHRGLDPADGFVLRGPSAVDLYARPGAGAVLVATVCPEGRLGTTAGLAATLAAADDAGVAAWRGGGPAARLAGCRRIELGPVPDDGPVRVRLSAGPGAAGTWRGLAWRGGTAPATAEAGSGAPRPGVTPPRLLVLYVPDALRADAVGHLGGAGGRGGNPTPVLDRLAAEGRTFRRHRTTAPNTLLSIRHLFTGRNLVDTAAWDVRSAGLPTLAERLGSAGYRTGLFSGNSYLSEDFGLARGFDHVSEEALFEPPRGASEREAIATGWVNRSAEHVHDAALDWLDSLGPLRDAPPVFLHLQTIHPHGPYVPPADLERRFTEGIESEITGGNETLVALARGRRRASPADRERLRGLYRGGLAYNDRELARFLAALAERVPPEETVVVVTSDHGEELFDHGGVLHGYTLYEELLRVPLVVWGPGRVAPGTSDRLTDTLDLHATLLALAGIGDADGEAPASAGRSLLPELAGEREPADASDLEPRFAAADGPTGGAFAVRWGRWKYIWVRGTPRSWWMGQGPGRVWLREHLFDLEADPGESRNLAGGDGVIEGFLRTTLRAWADERLAERNPPPGGTPLGPAEPTLDREERERLRALGYVD